MKQKVISIVEGYGEVTAVPQLLRKILHEHHGCYELEIPEAMRRSRAELAKADSLVRAVRIARGEKGCAGILVLFDEDDDCAVALGERLQTTVEDNISDVPVYIVLAVKEYESWLLASMEALKGKGGLIATPKLPVGGPESVRDAKGWIKKNMGPGLSYSQTVDQAKLTAQLDLRLAHQHARSFRKLWKSMDDLVQRLGFDPIPL